MIGYSLALVALISLYHLYAVLIQAVGYVWTWELLAFCQIAGGLLLSPVIIWHTRRAGSMNGGLLLVALIVLVPSGLLNSREAVLSARTHRLGHQKLLNQAKTLIEKRQEQEKSEGSGQDGRRDNRVWAKDVKLCPELHDLIGPSYATVTNDEVQIKLGGSPDSYVGLHLCPFGPSTFSHGRSRPIAQGIYFITWDMPTEN